MYPIGVTNIKYGKYSILQIVNSQPMLVMFIIPYFSSLENKVNINILPHSPCPREIIGFGFLLKIKFLIFLGKILLLGDVSM